MAALSHIWPGLQAKLFPFLEDVWGPLTGKQKELVSVLEAAGIEELVSSSVFWRGRPAKDRRAIARAFIAKSIYNLTTTRQLIDYLRATPNLRRICGWERVSDIPSESVFSRVFAFFAERGIPQRVHERMIKNYERDRLVGHISRDSTAIEAREKAHKKPSQSKIKLKRKRGRPKKGEYVPAKEPGRLERQQAMTVGQMLDDLPTACDWGVKKDSHGKRYNWRGYKLHIDWADGGIPVSCVLTSASVYDNQAAIPLSRITAERVINLYDLMDAAYDCDIIKKQSRSLGHIPLIDSNPRRGEKAEMEPAAKVRYNERNTAERGFARLKDEFGGRHIRVKGHIKVLAHLMFSIIALCADQLLKLLI
jgi:hypothetical protein